MCERERVCQKERSRKRDGKIECVASLKGLKQMTKLFKRKFLFFFILESLCHILTFSSSMNYFQCGIMYWSDWFLGQQNRFYSIGDFECVLYCV